jgi:hypothetical protein
MAKRLRKMLRELGDELKAEVKFACHERGGGAEACPYRVGAFPRRRLCIDDGRVDRARTDRIDPIAAVLEFGRPRSHKRTNACLGGAVGGVAWNAFEGGDRRNQDDGAAVTQKRQRLLDREEKPAHIDAEGLVEILFRDLDKRFRIDEARICDRISIFPFSCLILS